MLKKVFRKIDGNAVKVELQDVTEASLGEVKDIYVNGGGDTKGLLEQFGIEKLGIVIDKSFKVDRMYKEAILPELKKRLDMNNGNQPKRDPISSVVTEAHAELDTDLPLAKDMDTNEAIADGFIKDDETVDDKVLKADIPPNNDMMVSDNEKGANLDNPTGNSPLVPAQRSSHLINENTRNVFIWTVTGAGMPHMRPCDKEGTLV